MDFILNRINEWVSYAQWAPSGDNRQPWDVSFQQQGSELKIFIKIDSEYAKANHNFDVQFSAAYIALGAFALNLIKVAELDGAELTKPIEYVDNIFVLIFRMSSENTEKFKDSDHKVLNLIKNRRVNRYPFKTKPITSEILKEMSNFIENHVGLKLLPIIDKDKMNNISKIFFRLDLVRYLNLKYLNEFLDELRFGEESSQLKDGLDYRTLCVPAPVWMILKILRRFRFLAPFYSLTSSHSSAYLGCYRLLQKSGGIFFLTIEGDDPLSWFKLGMGFQDLWLLATEKGLRFQPFGTPLILRRHGLGIDGKITSVFSNQENKILIECHEKFKSLLGIDTYKPCIAFRMGEGPENPKVAFRKELKLN